MQIDWLDYHRVHRNKTNLVLHLIAVPLFVSAIVLLAIYLVRGEFVLALMSLLAAVIAMAMQGRGHKLETETPRPFSGAANFLNRWFTEQFVIFPLFFLSGRWWRQYCAADRNHGNDSDEP